MVMNEEEVREECVKLAELVAVLLREKAKLENIAHEQSVEIFDYKKMVAGAQNKEELLLNYIDNICGIIEAEMPLRYQDEWLERCIKRGFYNTTTIDLKTCCRNGCERCEQ